MQKIPLVSVLILVVGAGFILLGFGSRAVQAQEPLYETPEQAFLAALGKYMTAVGDDAAWVLGEIKQSGNYAYSIAQAGENVDDYQGFIMLLARKDTENYWSAVGPQIVSNAEYNQWLAEVPDDLIGTFGKSYYYLYDSVPANLFSPRAVPLHRFPWPINFQAVLTQKDGSYHTNQLDFVMRSTDDIYASKPGLVIFVKDSSSIGGCDMDLWPWANFVVVQHSATEYTWYVHLKYGSATVNVGDLIGYGTKIGEQGNTGFACGTTGIHLHYMVSSEIPSGWPDPNVPNYAPWPPSGSIFPVDFVESTYASLVEGMYYVSQNASPPGVCNTAPTQVSFFDNTYCNSNLFSIGSSGFVDLISLGIDARLESIEIPTGWSVGLYLDQNELGGKTCLNQSDSMLWDNLFDDGERVANNVLWARIYDAPDCPYPFEQGIVFYPEGNFGGIPLWGMVGERSSNEPGYEVGSIYVPDIHSAVIYDQDGLAGNSLCLSGSVLNLSLESGWSGNAVESVSLLYGDTCEPIPNPVPVPVLVSPEDGGVSYLEAPELCWQLDEPGFSFNVQIFGEGYSEGSGWISEMCWMPPGLVGRSGTYSWQVQAKNVEGQISNWSSMYQFTLLEDTNPPTAEFLYLEEGGSVVRPRTYLNVAAHDAETEVVKVHFFAWYDEGSSVGYDWRYLGADDDGSDGWAIIWNLTVVESSDAAVWSYVEDAAGNFNSVFLSGLNVVASLPNESGFEGRDTGDSSREEGSSSPAPVGGDDPDEVDTTELPGEEVPEAVEEKPPASISGPVPGEELPKPKLAAPILVSPTLHNIYYLPELVFLCWEGDSTNADLAYRVEINGAVEIRSDWMQGVCWQPLGLEPGSGSYTWRVRSRHAGLGLSEWSVQGAFQLERDTSAPLVSYESPTVSASVSDELLIQLTASDEESGLKQAHYMAWYDDGSGAQWHLLAKVPISNNEVVDFLWDISEITPQKVQLWVYMEDQSGNLGSAMVSEIFVSTPAVNQPVSGRYVKSLFDTVYKDRIAD